MLLNMLRLEEADPSMMVKQSFLQAGQHATWHATSHTTCNVACNIAHNMQCGLQHTRILFVHDKSCPVLGGAPRPSEWRMLWPVQSASTRSSVSQPTWYPRRHGLSSRAVHAAIGAGRSRPWCARPVSVGSAALCCCVRGAPVRGAVGILQYQRLRSRPKLEAKIAELAAEKEGIVLKDERVTI